MAAGVFADVEKTIRDPQAAAKRLAAQASANWQRSSQETRDPDAWRQFWREWGDVAIGFTPVDLLYDAVNIFRDTDLITGKRLTTFDKALMVVGVFTAGFGDDIVKGGGRLLRNLDKVDAADAVRAGRGLGHLDEGIDASRAARFLDTDRARWSYKSKRWHALEDLEFNGKLYRKGHFVPSEAIYPPRRFGITPEMERAIIESLPEGHILALRDRPLGAALLDGTIDAKRGWIEDWMILKKHDQGVRELIDARKVKAGEYENVKRIFKDDKWGYDFQLKQGDPPVFVPETKFEKYIPGDTPHNNVDVTHLTGQYVLSDLDAAIYSDLSRSLVDKTYIQEFAQIFNEEYLGGLAPRHHIISHGALYEGLTNKPEVVEKLSKVPGRIEKLEAEDVIVFANLPDKGKVGFQEVISYKEAVKRFAEPQK